MASNSTTKNPKKANLLDPHSIKHLLDESVTEVNRFVLSFNGDRSIISIEKWRAMFDILLLDRFLKGEYLVQ